MLLISLLVAGCKKDDPTVVNPTDGPVDPYDVEIGPYEVDVRTTSYGIPHILADDYGSAAFGMGWAHARDHLCTLADQIVKVKSERAALFGLGEGDANVDSDFGWLGLRVFAQAEASFTTLPEHIRDSLVGYAAGYNRYLEDTDPNTIDPRCRGSVTLRPITHIDLLAYYLHLGQLGSGYNLVAEVGNAQPPVGRSARQPPPPLSVLEPYRAPPIGSNGWAIGRDRTENGHGMLLSNTHFPAEGELQWWESQLTIPGEVNVYGASLIGAAVVNIGFTEHHGWTHTVSDTPRFIVYQLDLDPADPTRYEFDGDTVAMEGTDYTIDVLQDDGSTVPLTRTLYRTQWGPVFNAPVIGWNAQHAYTWRDVNDGNLGLIPSFAGMSTATTMDEFEAAHRDYQGIPWVHTMYTDADGTVMYLDSAATPNLTPAAEAAYQSYVETDSISSLFGGFGLIVVDGKDPVYTWVDDPRSVLPGAIPYDDAPRLVRTDFVNNSNENYWLANPLEPLTGYPMLYGPTGVPVAPRTKMNNRFLLEEDGASGADHKFSLAELETAALSARASLEEDLRAQVVARCTGIGEVGAVLDGVNIIEDVGPACAVLAAWDGRAAVDSVGAHVWREWVGAQQHTYSDLAEQGSMFADTFDAANPIYTPTTLAEGDIVLQALAAAVHRLGEAGIPVDAALGDVQYRLKDDERIPTLGGNYIEGTISVATFRSGNTTLLPIHEQGPVISDNTGLTDEGYYINNGNSWVLALSFTDDGPEAKAIMTYSESENPESPHFADQSHLYVGGEFRPVLFTEADIAADPELEVVHLTY